MKKALIAVLIFALILISVVLFVNNEAGISSEKVKVVQSAKLGFVGELSDEASLNVLLGVEAAVAAVSQGNIQLVEYDSKNTLQDTESSFRQAVNDGILAVISTNFNYSVAAEKTEMPAIFLHTRNYLNRTRDTFFWGIEMPLGDFDNTLSILARLHRDFSFSNAALLTHPASGNRFYDSVISISLRILNIPVKTYSANEVKAEEIRDYDLIVLSADGQYSLKFVTENADTLKPKVMLLRHDTFSRFADYEGELPPYLYFHLPVEWRSSKSDHDAGSPFASFSANIMETSGKDNVNHSALNAYDATMLLLSSSGEGDIEARRQSLAASLWATSNHAALRGTLSADGREGLLKRDYYQMINLKGGRRYIITGP
jgi:hypothetical protein